MHVTSSHLADVVGEGEALGVGELLGETHTLEGTTHAL